MVSSSVIGTPTKTDAPEILAQLIPEQLFDALATRVDGPRAWDLDLAIDVVLTDLERSFRLALRNGVLVHVEKPADAATAGLTLTLTKSRLLALGAGDTTGEGVELVGDRGVLQALLGVLTQGEPDFAIVTP